MLTSPAFRTSQSSASSKSRASLRPTWRVKRRRASGSVAHGLSLRTSAKTPTCAHSFHTNARSRSVASCLSVEICIFDSEEDQRLEQFTAEARGRIVGDRPAGGLEKLVARRIKSTEILLVLTRPLIRGGVELEMNLVEATCKPCGEEAAVLAPLQPRFEALRKAEIEQAGGAGVEPVTGETEVEGDSSGRFDQCLWERVGTKQIGAATHRQHVDVREWL